MGYPLALGQILGTVLPPALAAPSPRACHSCMAGGLWGEAAVAWGSLPPTVCEGPEVCEVYTECCLVTRLRLLLLGQ